jgi:hypothetical protein
LDQTPLFKTFLDETFGRKKWSPRANRWWIKEIEEERDILSEARRTTAPGSDQFKQACNRWVRAIRKAKRECWERFLEASDPGTVWKSINAKPQQSAIPSILITPSGKQCPTLEEKMEAIAQISFPTKNGRQNPNRQNREMEPQDTYKPEGDSLTICPKMLKRLLRK